MKIIKTESLHMIVDGQYLEDLTRQLYWFEDNELGAVTILKEGLRGITDRQVINIINGDAVLRGSSICDNKKCSQCKGLKRLTYNENEDKKFKLEITKRKLWLHENTYKIDQYHIRKETIREYLQMFNRNLNLEDDDKLRLEYTERARIYRKAIWSTNCYQIPNADFIPEKGSRDYIFTKIMSSFLKGVENEIIKAFEEKGYAEKVIEEILNKITVIKEPTVSKVRKQPVKGEGCTVIKVPDPTNNYKYKSINIPKEQLLNYLKTRSRGEVSLKFTLNLDLDKDKVLKRYKNLQKQMGLVHEKLMDSMNLGHSDSGIYPRQTLEFFVNEAVQFFVLRTSIWHEGKTLDKLPDEIKLKLPPNHGYVDVYVDGKLVEEKRDLR